MHSLQRGTELLNLKSPQADQTRACRALTSVKAGPLGPDSLLLEGMMMREKENSLCCEGKCKVDQETASVQLGRAYRDPGQPPARKTSTFAFSHALYAKNLGGSLPIQANECAIQLKGALSLIDHERKCPKTLPQRLPLRKLLGRERQIRLSQKPP
jgi:hypothetical protein